MRNNQEILESFYKYRQANSKSKKTLECDKRVLNVFLQHINNKPLEQVIEEDTQSFIKKQKTLGTRTMFASKLILFFRWLHKLEKRKRPSCMKWYDYPTAKQIRKNGKADVKQYLITDEEYTKIMNFVSANPKWSALFETLYLSGARPNEIMQMNISDIEIDSDGKVTIKLTDSKSLPRKVPLPDTPNNLIRWLEYHPLRHNNNAPLFISNSARNYHKRHDTFAINIKFNTIKEKTGIKSTLTPHCFRKTRATIMFSARTKDGGKKFDEGDMAKFFGWTPITVSQRRNEYDLRDFEDLKKLVQGNIKPVETFDNIKAERDTLAKKQQEKIDTLEQELSDLKELFENTISSVNQYTK